SRIPVEIGRRQQSIELLHRGGPILAFAREDRPAPGAVGEEQVALRRGRRLDRGARTIVVARRRWEVAQLDAEAGSAVAPARGRAESEERRPEAEHEASTQA